ncbi:MAG: DUF1330 domain-containing protein [Sphingomonadaceae bacterium]
MQDAGDRLPIMPRAAPQPALVSGSSKRCVLSGREGETFPAPKMPNPLWERNHDGLFRRSLSHHKSGRVRTLCARYCPASKAAATAWYESPEYEAIKHLRTDNSEGSAVLVDPWVAPESAQ